VFSDYVKDIKMIEVGKEEDEKEMDTLS
jgi:hypothetical protein